MDLGDTPALEFLQLRCSRSNAASLFDNSGWLSGARGTRNTTTRHPTMDDVDPRLAEGVRLFNEREFFACHDVLEEVWTETLEGREFYQGLIHVAVALFHFGEGNLGGARKMAGSAVRYLAPFRPVCRGVDVERLMDDFQLCFAELLAPHAEYPQGLTLDETRIPVIQLRDA